MRLVVILALLLVLAPVAQAEEIGSQWNDSNTVQLPGGPDTYPGDTSVPDQGTGGGTGTGQGGDAGGVGGGSTGTGSGNGGSGSSDIIIFSNSSPGSGSGSGGTAGGDDTVSLLDALVTSGGLSGSSFVSSDDAASSALGSGGVYIDGVKVRAALQGKGILRVTLRAYGAGGGALSNADLGLIGASTMLKNPSLESAFISLTRFDIMYRSQGYLLAFLPVSFPVRISVNPAGASLAERVTIKFPWYSFFLRKFVTKPGLVRDIDAILTKEADPSADRSQLQAKLFIDVSLMLQSRVDTVEESVRSP